LAKEAVKNPIKVIKPERSKNPSMFMGLK